MTHGEGHSGEIELGRPAVMSEFCPRVYVEARQTVESSHISEFLNIPCVVFSRVVTRKVSR